MEVKIDDLLILQLVDARKLFELVLPDGKNNNKIFKEWFNLITDNFVDEVDYFVSKKSYLISIEIVTFVLDIRYNFKQKLFESI